MWIYLLCLLGFLGTVDLLTLEQTLGLDTFVDNWDSSKSKETCLSSEAQCLSVQMQVLLGYAYVYPAISPKDMVKKKIAAEAGLDCLKHKNGSWKATFGTNVLNLWQNWIYNLHKQFPCECMSPATHFGLYWTKHWAAFLVSENQKGRVSRMCLLTNDLTMSLRFYSRVHPSLFTAAWVFTTGLHKPTCDHILCCLWTLQFCYYTISIAKHINIPESLKL